MAHLFARQHASHIVSYYASWMLLGYSILFAGNFIKNTAPLTPAPGAAASNPQLTYVQYSYRW